MGLLIIEINWYRINSILKLIVKFKEYLESNLGTWEGRSKNIQLTDNK